jgi:hypothetical protein
MAEQPQNGHEEDVAKYEQELSDYLQQRIKPGLNRGAIPLVARSIAKEIAHRDHPGGASGDGEAGEENEAAPDFEADMHDFQAELGDDWILRFSVQGDKAWLTAEKEDGSECVEAETAEELAEAVGRLEQGGGDRST